MASANALARSLTPVWRRIAEQLLGDASLAADAAQDVAAQVFAHLDSWDGRASVKTWSHRIALNRCHDLLRREARERRFVPLEAAHAVASTPPGVDPLLRRHVARAVAELPRELADVVALRYGADLSFAEAASTLGLPQGTVSTRLRRALEMLSISLASMRGHDDA